MIKKKNFFEYIHYLLTFKKINRKQLRLCVEPNLEFAEQDVSNLEASQGTWFLYSQMPSLIGIDGALPQHYTERVLHQIHKKEFAFKAFLDIFHDRSLWLLYDVYSKYNYSHKNIDERNILTDTLLSLAGYSPYSSCSTPLPRNSFAYYSQIFFTKTRTAMGLQYLLATYFSLPVTIMENEISYLTISNENLTKLPGCVGDGQNCQLGRNTVLGDRYKTKANKIKITIGSVKSSQFQKIILDKAYLKAISEVTRLYIGDVLSFDIQIKLYADESIYCRLANEKNAILGRNAWCFAQASTQAITSITLVGDQR